MRPAVCCSRHTLETETTARSEPSQERQVQSGPSLVPVELLGSSTERSTP
jgi:hypothetical protein